MNQIDRYHVALTTDARDDLAEIARYRAGRRGLDDAEALLDAISTTSATLERFPLRGATLKELYGSGESKVRQTPHGVYRIFYEVDADKVAVFLIADGRRDMQKLLRHRLVTRDRPG